MADFTSALYLGFRHPHATLAPWASLTLGMPAALREPAGAGEVARALASLAGAETAALWPSTLHLFWDLFAVLGAEGCAVLFDGGAYPVARWGAAPAGARGARIARFNHFDTGSLEEALASHASGRGRCIVVTDGFCTGCGRSAPLTEYARAVGAAGGLLVVDDTQALGILGSRPGPHAPYGEGGGGSLRRHGVQAEHILWTSSLAKGFGVPLAALAAAEEVVERVRRLAPTTVHTSPPSAAAIAAAARAVVLNRSQGEARRRALSGAVRALREVLSVAGLPPAGGAFPVQRVALGSGLDTERLHGALARRGVRTALVRAGCTGRTEIAFLVTAAHTAVDVREVGMVLAEIGRRCGDVDDGGWSRARCAGVPASKVG